MSTTSRQALDLGPTGRTVAENLKRVREERRLSLRQLAEQANGVNLTAHALTHIENQKRRVSVDELTALAVALDVNPNALLLPHDDAPERTTEVTGADGPVTRERAWDWADGHHPLIPAPDDEGQHQQIQFELIGRPPLRRLLFSGFNHLGAEELFTQLPTAVLRRLASIGETEAERRKRDGKS
jgi:transcriptional regulator with XRE-family HTH domain